MSDIPTKTYPPEFLQRLVDDHEAERQAAPELPTQHRGDNLLQVEATELPGAAFADIEFEKAGATTEESSVVERKGDAMSDIARWAAFDGGIAPHPYGKWILCDDHQAEVERLTQERDEARAERDTAQRERDRVQGLLWLRGRELPTLQRDQPAQNVNMVSGQTILDSSRPDDETIWREAFMSQLHDRYWAASEVADVALAEYRKRWPR